MMKLENTLIDARKMAEVTNIPLSSIWRGCRENTIPHYRYGRIVRFNLDEVLESLRANSITTGNTR